MDVDRTIAQGFVGWVVLALILGGCAVGVPLVSRLTIRHRSRPAMLHFTPPVIASEALIISAIALIGGGIIVSLFTGWWPGMFVSPLVALLGTFLLYRIARWWYCRRLHQQVSLALSQLTALIAGSASLLSGFRSVAASAGWPLSAEWRWVDQQVNQPIVVRESGRVYTRYVDHAMALLSLAQQTPDPLHAQALTYLAGIYESGSESYAHQRLRAITDAITHIERTRRDIRQTLGRVTGQSYIIVGAMAFLLGWLLVTQTERFTASFLNGFTGIVAALWFGFWFVAPIVTARLLTRMPEWTI